MDKKNMIHNIASEMTKFSYLKNGWLMAAARVGRNCLIVLHQQGLFRQGNKHL